MKHVVELKVKNEEIVIHPTAIISAGKTALQGEARIIGKVVVDGATYSFNKVVTVVFLKEEEEYSMADWQFKLELKDAWKKHDDGEMSIVDVAKTVAERSKALVIEVRERVKNPRNVVDRIISKDLEHLACLLETDIIPMFEELVDTENDDADDFDYALENLYDWADTSLDNEWGGKKMCWVSTVI